MSRNRRKVRKDFNLNIKSKKTMIDFGDLFWDLDDIKSIRLKEVAQYNPTEEKDSSGWFSPISYIITHYETFVFIVDKFGKEHSHHFYGNGVNHLRKQLEKLGVLHYVEY